MAQGPENWGPWSLGVNPSPPTILGPEGLVPSPADEFCLWRMLGTELKCGIHWGRPLCRFHVQNKSLWSGLIFNYITPEIVFFSTILYTSKSQRTNVCSKGLPCDNRLFQSVPGLWARVLQLSMVGLRNPLHLSESGTTRTAWVWEFGRLWGQATSGNLFHDFLVLPIHRNTFLPWGVVRILQKGKGETDINVDFDFTSCN